MENKKGKIKYKNKAFRRATNAFIIATAVCTGSMLVGIVPAVHAEKANKKINNICSDIISSESYIDHVKEKQADYMDALENGTLTKDEYLDKLEKLTTVTYVRGNIETLAPEKVDEVNELEEEYYKYGRIALGITCGSGALALANCIPAAAMIPNYKYKAKEETKEEMEM